MKKPKIEEIQCEIGQVIDITLESMMGSTGYGWELSELDGPMNLLSIQTIPSLTQQIGPVAQKFYFRATAKGKAKVSFVLTAAWKTEDPIQTINYEITVDEASKASEDDLKLDGFVDPPKVGVTKQSATLYAVWPPPTPDYGILPHCQPRQLYNVQVPVNQNTLNMTDPRLYYGVCCAPASNATQADPRFYYGVCCDPNANVAQADPRLYYGVCCDPASNVAQPADPRFYYGVCCEPTDDWCGTPPKVLKYGIPLAMPPYGVLPLYNVPPMQKYNIPPMMRYNYPSKDTDCC